jgi:hypothetical protein
MQSHLASPSPRLLIQVCLLSDDLNDVIMLVDVPIVLSNWFKFQLQF